MHRNGDIHKHGGKGSEDGEGSREYLVDLSDAGTIIEIRVDGGTLVDSLEFRIRYTNGTLRTVGPFGGQGGDWNLIEGCLYGFWGRSVDCINHLGFSGGPLSFCTKPPYTP